MLVLFVKLFEVNCGNRDESLKLWNYVDPSNVFIYVRKYRDIYEKKKKIKIKTKIFLPSIHIVIIILSIKPINVSIFTNRYRSWCNNIVTKKKKYCATNQQIYLRTITNNCILLIFETFPKSTLSFPFAYIQVRSIDIGAKDPHRREK